jgi:hypothetical protein
MGVEACIHFQLVRGSDRAVGLRRPADGRSRPEYRQEDSTLLCALLPMEDVLLFGKYKGALHRSSLGPDESLY